MYIGEHVNNALNPLPQRVSCTVCSLAPHVTMHSFSIHTNLATLFILQGHHLQGSLLLFSNFKVYIYLVKLNVYTILIPFSVITNYEKFSNDENEIDSHKVTTQLFYVHSAVMLRMFYLFFTYAYHATAF